MRFGLVGTGPWAELAHGPGLVAADGVELVGVWGRTPGRVQPLAQTLGVTAYDDYGALLADVDAVAFAVPPAVQAEMALAAARAGKHLLLDKPVAADPGAARALLSAAGEAGVASVVFFTEPPAASHYEATLWGEAGLSTMPPRPEGSFGALLATAAEELVQCAASEKPHELDLRFGVRVVELLAHAQELIDRAATTSGAPA